MPEPTPEEIGHALRNTEIKTAHVDSDPLEAIKNFECGFGGRNKMQDVEALFELAKEKVPAKYDRILAMLSIGSENKMFLDEQIDSIISNLSRDMQTETLNNDVFHTYDTLKNKLILLKHHYQDEKPLKKTRT